MISRLLIGAAVLASIGLPGAIAAQTLDDGGTPSPTIEQTLPHSYGIVKARTQWHLQLADGRTVDLSKATIILPTGATIGPGDRIGVFGAFSRPMVIRAAAITVISDGTAGVQTVR